MTEPYAWEISSMLALNFDGGGFVDFIMYGIAYKFTWIPLYIGVLYYILKMHGWKKALLFVAVAALLILCVDQTATFAKNNFSKFRPNHYPPLEGLLHNVNGYKGGLYGTISSHAANTMAFAMLSYSLIRKKAYLYMMIAFVTLNCYSRIYLGAHYPLDILLGIFEAIIWSAVWIFVYNKIAVRIK